MHKGRKGEKQTITIDEEFKSLIPPLSEDEYSQLEANCVMEGIRDPLVVWKKADGSLILLDGHNRMRISAEHGGIPYQIVEKEFESRDKATIWIIQNQFGRRNLTPYQRSVLALRLKPLLADMAKAKQSTHTEQGYQKSDKATHTSKELAKIAGVSHDTIHKVEVIERSPNEEIKQKARSGEMTTNQAYNAVMVEQAKAEGRIPQTQAQKKRQEVTEAYERHEAYDQSGVANIADARQDREDRRTIALEWYGNMKTALKNLYWTGALNKTELFSEMRRALTNEERKKLIERIEDARMVLDAALSELED